jgi:hypothetical protein
MRTWLSCTLHVHIFDLSMKLIVDFVNLKYRQNTMNYSKWYKCRFYFCEKYMPRKNIYCVTKNDL